MKMKAKTLTTLALMIAPVSYTHLKAKEGLDFVVLAAIRQTVDYLFEKNAPIHSRVLEAYNEIVRR